MRMPRLASPTSDKCKVALGAMLLLLAASMAACGAGASSPQGVVGDRSGGQVAERTVLVSAAASLTDVLDAIKKEYESRNPSVRVQLNLGSSGALQQQIEQGAPVDVLISVSRKVTDALVQKGYIDGQAVRILASNALVLVRPTVTGDVRPPVNDWRDLGSSAVRKVALGNPEHVPAGQYGRSTLEKLGLWDKVAPKLVLGEDVRQVLNYVASGEVDAGIVYNTDAAVSSGVKVVAKAPEDSHAPVLYPVAVLKQAPHPTEAQAFAGFLFTDQAQAILKRFGFGPVR